MSIENKIISTIEIENRAEEKTCQTTLVTCGEEEKMNSTLQEQKERLQKQEESVSGETPPLEPSSPTISTASPSMKVESTPEELVGELSIGSTETAQSLTMRPVWLCTEWTNFEKSWAVDPTFMNPDWLRLEERSSDWFTEEEVILFPESQTKAAEEKEEELTETEERISLARQISPEQQKTENEEGNQEESLDFDQNEEALPGKENSGDGMEASLFEEASSLDQDLSNKEVSLKEEISSQLQEKTSVEKEDGEEDEPALREETSGENEDGEKEVSLPDKAKEEKIFCNEENKEKVEKFQDWESDWEEEGEKNESDQDSRQLWESTPIEKKEAEKGQKWNPMQSIEWFDTSTIREQERRVEKEEELERQELQRLWREAYERECHDHEEGQEQIKDSAFSSTSLRAGNRENMEEDSSAAEENSLFFTFGEEAEKETSLSATKKEPALSPTTEETSLSVEEATSLSSEGENTSFSPTKEETSLSASEEETSSSAEEENTSSSAREKESSSLSKKEDISSTEEDTSSSPGEENASFSIKVKEQKKEGDGRERVEEEWEAVWKTPWEEAVKRDWNFEEDQAVEEEPIEEKTQKESQEISPELDRNERARRLWLRCEECGSILYRKHVKQNNKVCFTCASHLDMSSEERIENLIDANSWKPINDQISPGDPLEFEDEKRYLNRLEESQERTGLQDAIQTGTAMIEGIPIALGVMDFQFMGGSMGSVVGEKITRLIEYALEEGLFLVLVCASGGARMQEGIFSLMQMAKISGALSLYKSCGNLLYISLLTSPTTGGVTASFAMLGDIIIAEPKAVIGFAGRRVIEQTLQEELPENFQTAEYLHFHGLIDLIVHRRHLREAFFECISFHQNASLKKGNMIKSYYSGNGALPSNPGNGALPSNPGNGVSPSNPGNGALPSNPGNGALPINPGNGVFPPNEGDSNASPPDPAPSETQSPDEDSTPDPNDPARSKTPSPDGDSIPDPNRPARSETPSPDGDLTPDLNGTISPKESFPVNENPLKDENSTSSV